MEEENQDKSLKETVLDLKKTIDTISGQVKPKKKININWLGAFISLIIGGFVFTMTWIFWDMTMGVAFGIIAFSISMFIASKFDPNTWRLPLKARFLGKKKKRKGYVVFMNIGTNKAITFTKAQIEEGVAMVNGVPHTVNPQDIHIWKNKIPIVITFQGAEKPITMDNYYRTAKANGESTEGWEYIMNYIYKTQIKDKKSVPAFLIIVGIIAVIGLGYYLIKSGAFK